MRTQHLVAVPALLAAVAGIACSNTDSSSTEEKTSPTTPSSSGGSGPSSPPDASTDGPMTLDPRALYFGTWAYQEGSAFVVSCPGIPAVVQDLSKAGANGSNGTFELSPRGAGIHEVDGLGCEYDFTLRDDAAVAPSVETCERFPDGRGGFTRLTTDVTHKTTRDGRTMVVSAHAKVAGDCDLYVEGFATKNDASLPAIPATTDDVTRYQGTWVYEKSSALLVACNGKPASITDLATASNGAPGSFRIDATGSSLRETDGLGCIFDMSLVDGRMTTTKPETCDKLPAGLLTTKTTHKASWDGKHMVVAASANVGTDCQLYVSAIATKAQ